MVPEPSNAEGLGKLVETVAAAPPQPAADGKRAYVVEFAGVGRPVFRERRAQA